MSEAPGPILILAGPSGAGKTTVGALVAADFEPSAHIQADLFGWFLVNGADEASLPASARQDEVLGAAVVAAALELATGGYTIVLDGHIFPEVLGGVGHWTARRGVALHYVVLRPDLATCVTRVDQRQPGHPEDLEAFTRLHHRYADLGDHEANVVDAAGTPQEVAAAVLAAFSSGRLVVATPPPGLLVR